MEESFAWRFGPAAEGLLRLFRAPKSFVSFRRRGDPPAFRIFRETPEE
jgi:hypothetical protein